MLENKPLKAIELVRAKRELEENTGWQLVDYTKTLLRLMEKSGDQEGYEKELRYLVLKLKCQDVEFVSQLKKITTAEQWPAVFETLLEDAKWPGDRMRLYHFEENYSGLFAELCRYPSLDNFQRYAEDLRKWDLQRTLQLYTEILKVEMGRACDRNQYSYVASHLSKLSAYPGGQECAKELAAFWYVYHENRPAMKDELKKAGYPAETMKPGHHTCMCGGSFNFVKEFQPPHPLGVGRCRKGGERNPEHFNPPTP